MLTTGNMSTMKTMEEFVSIVQPQSPYIYIHTFYKKQCMSVTLVF